MRLGSTTCLTGRLGLMTTVLDVILLELHCSRRRHAGIAIIGAIAASGVSEPTIARLESEDGQIGGRAETAEKLIAAFEKAGVVFIAENGGGAGVRLRRRGV